MNQTHRVIDANMALHAKSAIDCLSSWSGASPGSRASFLPLFFVELGASIIVASTMLAFFLLNHQAMSCQLTVDLLEQLLCQLQVLLQQVPEVW
ncbi:hypothetical protein [Alcanivorax sp.]|uniref:hypothetical protein n=1 Tax=Alcanivorax sp. TaxID=1872427 RepID=UPI0025C51DFB|nr:hypothetical protein [Alcanivorax sp.]